MDGFFLNIFLDKGDDGLDEFFFLNFGKFGEVGLFLLFISYINLNVFLRRCSIWMFLYERSLL